MGAHQSVAARLEGFQVDDDAKAVSCLTVSSTTSLRHMKLTGRCCGISVKAASRRKCTSRPPHGVRASIWLSMLIIDKYASHPVLSSDIAQGVRSIRFVNDFGDPHKSDHSRSALCFLHSGDFASATNLLKECPPMESSTQYILFLLAIKQGGVHIFNFGFG